MGLGNLPDLAKAKKSASRHQTSIRVLYAVTVAVLLVTEADFGYSESKCLVPNYIDNGEIVADVCNNLAMSTDDYSNKYFYFMPTILFCIILLQIIEIIILDLMSRKEDKVLRIKYEKSIRKIVSNSQSFNMKEININIDDEFRKKMNEFTSGNDISNEVTKQLTYRRPFFIDNFDDEDDHEPKLRLSYLWILLVELAACAAFYCVTTLFLGASWLHFINALTWVLSTENNNITNRVGIFNPRIECIVEFDFYSGIEDYGWIKSTFFAECSRPKTILVYISIALIQIVLIKLALDVIYNFIINVTKS